MVTLVWGGGEGVLGEGSPPPWFLIILKKPWFQGPGKQWRCLGSGARPSYECRSEHAGAARRGLGAAQDQLTAPHTRNLCSGQKLQCHDGLPFEADVEEREGGGPDLRMDPAAHDALGCLVVAVCVHRPPEPDLNEPPAPEDAGGTWAKHGFRK